MAKRSRVQKSEINPVPLYRSYGVTKKEGFFAKLNNVIAAVLAAILFALLFVTWGLGIYILISMLGTIGIAFAIGSVAAFVYIKFCRKIRKRVKFLRRLKKHCKRMGYTLKFHRGFFAALKLNGQGIDFTVDTGKKLWTVRFFTPKKHLSHIIFEDKNHVGIKTNITKSHFKFVLGFNNPKYSQFEYRYDDRIELKDRKSARALIINPVPHEVFKKDSDGAVIPIGTGERLFGYIMFTGSGFLEYLARDDDAQ
jgi:hypothetical protein